MRIDGARLNTARSNVVWPLPTSVDEGPASAASKARGDGLHGTRRRGLAPLGHCKLPLLRVLLAPLAGPKAAEVYSGQAMSGLTWLDHCQRPSTRVLRAQRAGPEETGVDSGQATLEIDVTTMQQCPAQGGKVWHLLATLNFCCLGFCKQSEPVNHFY
ncbi:hypothetical protein TYRP_006732 [Tyrophagus putrescentiae]|nr:hypothetical protein TYRP_006732 [Tyrophagus putrescentiae]